MLLPGVRASRMRLKAASLFVRVYGCDFNLATQICESRVLQELLATERPEDPRGVFGKAVEAKSNETDENESRVPPV